MLRYFKKTNYKLFGIKAAHFIITICLFFIFFLLFRYKSLSNISPYGFRYNYFAALLYAAMMVFFVRTYNAYLLGYLRIRELVFGLFLSQLISVILIYLVVSFAWNQFLNPLAFLPMLVIQQLFNVAFSYLGTSLFFKLNKKRKTLFVYRNQIDKTRFGSFERKPIERIFELSDELQFDGSFTELREHLEGYDTIFVAGVNSKCRNGILKYCKENNVQGFFLPHIGDTIMQDAEHVQAFDTPILNVSRKELDPEYAFIKRLFDIISSSIALVILSPFILIIALLIHFYDGGPALYRQTRLTKDGKEFQLLKFRSMRVDAEEDGIARLSTGEHDDRITPIGKTLRRFRLDEIPQLWNILVGDMSVVGPRPERPEIAKAYCEKMPDFQLRLQVKAGLTGYAQVYGKYNTDPYQKLEFDLLYINSMSILIDLQLCFATVAILFDKESTTGIEEDQTLAMIDEKNTD